MSETINRIPLTIVSSVNGETTEGVLVGVIVTELDALEASIDEDVSQLVERFRTALMREHHGDWTMEVVAEAAHICARSMVES